MSTVALLFASNLFMTAAWYGHLRYRDAALFVLFATTYLGERLRWNHFAGLACLALAAALIFRR